MAEHRTETVLVAPRGRFEVERPTGLAGPSLRAWDAADEFVLDHLAEDGVDGTRWLIANDAFGALTVAATERPLVHWTDSFVAANAARQALLRNRADHEVEFVPSTAAPTAPIDVAIVKVPKSIAHLRDQLRRLRPALHAGSVIVGAGMTRNVHNSTVAAFESLVGPTSTTRARKKARLLLADLDPDIGVPEEMPVRYETADGLVIESLPNVFSADRIDAGTDLLLRSIPATAPGSTVVDLACGNGVVAATLAVRNPGIEVVCCDESYEAVESARRNVGRVTTKARFHVADVLDGVEVVADTIVVNPPFHAGGARTTSVADAMFEAARQVLRPDGTLYVVGNRHLRHDRTLRRWFSAVEVVGSDPRFVVLAAR